MSNGIRNFTTFAPVAVLDEAQETIDEVLGTEPNTSDHFVKPAVEGEPLEEEESQVVPPTTDDADLVTDSQNSQTSEDSQEPKGSTKENDVQCNVIVEETYIEIQPLFENSVRIGQEQREFYRQIGVIVNTRRDKVEGSGYGKRFMARLSIKLGVSISMLQGICAYAAADPNGDAIPENLSALSWRRVVACARKLKTPAKFKEFLEAHSDLVTQSTEEFNKTLQQINPKGGNSNNSSGGKHTDDTLPLPEKIEEAKNALDKDLAECVKVSNSDKGLKFEMVFKDEQECAVVFKHFSKYLEAA